MTRTLLYRNGSKKQAAAGRSIVRTIQPAGSGADQDIWGKHVAVLESEGIAREEEAALLATMGYRAVQFRIGWPAIMNPDGTPNEEGITRCKQWISLLRQYDLTPIVAVYRWQRPLWMRLAGEWTNVKSAAAFSRYSALLHEQIGREALIRTVQGEPWSESAKELRQWHDADAVFHAPIGQEDGREWMHVQASGEFAYRS